MESNLREYLNGIDPNSVKMTPELMITLVEAMTNDAPEQKDSRAKAKNIFASIIWGAKKDGRALEFFAVMQSLNGKTNKSTGKDILRDTVEMMQIDHPLTIVLYNALQDNIAYFGKKGDSEKLKELGERIESCKLITSHQKTVLIKQLKQESEVLALKKKHKDAALQIRAIANKAKKVIAGIIDGTITAYNFNDQHTIHNALSGKPSEALLSKLIDLSGLPDPMRTRAKNMLDGMKQKQARTHTGTKQ